MKKHLALLSFLFSAISYSQIETKVKFSIFFTTNEPAPGVNIIVKNSKLIDGTQTDLNKNAEIPNAKENDIVQISYLGPTTPRFTLVKSVDSISINLDKQIAIYYSKSKKLKRIRLH